MPRLSCWFIRFSFLYLLLGFLLGGLILTNKGIHFLPQVWMLLPIHIDCLLIGWFSQLAFGVAFWILPRLGHERPRGNETITWISFLALNIGIGLVFASSLLNLFWLEALGRILETLAVVFFLISSWKRVRPFAG